MTQFLNWISNILFSQNENIIHFILIPACFIESAFLYTILMYSNWIGCRSRAGFLGGGVILIIGTLIFIKFYKIS